MTTLPPNPKKRRLGELLLEAGLINALQLNAALSEQRKWGGKLGRTLVEMGFVDEESMVLALSRQLNVPAVDLERAPLPANVTQLLRVDMAERYGVFPLGGDPAQKTLHVATSDPTNMEALQELAFHSGMRIHTSVSGSTQIDKAIRRYYYGERTSAVATATPEQVHMVEPTYDLAGAGRAGPEGGNTLPLPRVPDATMTMPFGIQQADLARKLEELSERMSLLEKHAANQVRALRGLFELLLEKKIITREEYLAKVKK